MSPRPLRPFVAAVLVAAGASSAHADLTDEQRPIQSELYGFQQASADAPAQGERAAPAFTRPVADCLAVVARGTQLGIAPTEALDGVAGKYLFKRAGETCEAYGRWKLIVETAVVIVEAHHKLQLTKHIEAGEVTSAWVKQFGDPAHACIKAIDGALAAGADATATITIDGEAITLPAAKTTWCQALIDWTSQFGAATDKAKADAEAAVRAKYTKHKIGGDRLKLMVEYDDVSWRVAGCAVEDDVAKLKKAGALFQWLENSDGTHTIRKYTFSGDKLIKTTNRTFTTEEAAYRGCR